MTQDATNPRSSAGAGYGRPLKPFSPPTSIRPADRGGSQPPYDDRAIIRRDHRMPFINGAPVDGHEIALKIHSINDEDGDCFVGVGPYGNLWDALVGGDLTVVSIDGRLSNPSNPGDSGWMSIGSGDNLYLKCEITDGDISEASLEIGSSSDLCEFSDYTQTRFRVVLARGESIGGAVVAVAMREGELVADATIINSKWAKYVR